MIIWYLGFTNTEKYELENILDSHEHYGLLDENTQKRINSYLDVNLIPDEYMKGRDYYKDHSLLNLNYLEDLPDGHLLKRNKVIGEKVKKLFTKEISPLLVDDHDLVGLPKSYFIIAEYDALKDENLIFSERLKRAGVNVTVKYYEPTYHGVLTALHLKVGREIFQDLKNYLKENIF